MEHLAPDKINGGTMSIRKIRTLYFAWDILFAIMVVVSLNYSVLVFPFFIINGVVLVIIYTVCNINIQNAIKKYQLEHPSAMEIYGNLRYHKSSHPEIKKYIDERNSLTPYAIINIALILGMLVNA